MRHGRVMKGTGDREGRYVRCKICHFPVDTWRHKTADGSGAGCQIDQASVYRDENFSQKVYVENYTDPTISIHFDSAGDLDVIKRETAVNITSGCPFCGARDYM